MPPCRQVEKTDKFSSGDQKAVADLTAEMISKAEPLEVASQGRFVFPYGFTWSVRTGIGGIGTRSSWAWTDLDVAQC